MRESRDPTTPAITVVVLNYNQDDKLERCLQSLERDASKGFAQIIVVDNASTDRSLLVARRNPWAHVIVSETNRGVAKGRNLGLAHARGEIILFLDSDAVVTADCLSAIVTTFEDPKVGIVGCEVRNPQDPRVIEEAGMSVDRFGFPIPSNLRNERLPYFYVSGCSIAVRKVLLHILGNFDERMSFCLEEIDLCWRFRLAGHDVRVATDAVVYHRAGSTFTGGAVGSGRYSTSLTRRYLGERHALTTMMKNYSTRSLVVTLPPYALLLASEIILACATLNIRLAWAYVKAVAWNISQLTETIRLRRKIQRSRRVPDTALPFDNRLGKWLSLRSVGLPRVVR